MVNNYNYLTPLNTRLIPKSPFKKASKAIRLYFNYAQDVASLPKFFYHCIFSLMMIASTFPLILSSNEACWGTNNQFSNILKFASFFWRWGAIWDSYTAVIISSSLIIGVYLAFFIPNLLFAGMYFIHGRISHMYCFFTCFANDFIIPIIVLWMPSELGLIMSLFFLHLEREELIGLIVFFVIILAFLIFHIIFNHCFVFPQLNYNDGRSVLWLGSSNSILYIFMCLQLFLTQGIEFIDNNGFRIFLIVCEFFVSFLFLLAGYMMNPTVKLGLSTIFVGLLEANMVIFIINIIQIYGVKFDVNIVFLIFLSGIFVGILSTHNRLRTLEIRSLKYYDDFLAGTATFSDYFHTPISFLHYSRNAFKNGHPYLFTWKSFIWAIEKFPNMSMIWMQFLRFLAIYYQDMNILIKYYDHYSKELKKKSMPAKTFLFYVRKCINSRNRHLNRDLASRFRAIDARIRYSNSLLIRYWSAIESDATSLAYILCKNLSDTFADIESYFNQLLLLYPNNAHICRKFAIFLLDYANDPSRAEYFKNRALFLSEQETYTIDITAQCAFEMFLLIPRSLEEVHRIADHDFLSFRSDESKSMSMKSTGSFSTVQTFHEEVEDAAASKIRDLGATTSVPFIRNMMIVSLLFFIIVYLLGSFSSPIIVNSYLNQFNSGFRVVTNLCDIMFYINHIPSLLLKEAMIVGKLYPIKEDELIFLTGSADSDASKFIPNTQQINEMTVRLNDLISDLESQFGNDIPVNSDIGRRIVSTKLRLISHIPINSSQSEESYSVYYLGTLFEALTTICGDFFSFSSSFSTDSIEFINEAWLTNSFVNSIIVSDELSHLSEMICDNLIALFNELILIIIILVSIFGGLSIIFLPILLLTIDKISVGWGGIMQTIQSLPRISIQSVILKLSRLTNKHMKNRLSMNIEDEEEEEEEDYSEDKQIEAITLKETQTHPDDISLTGSNSLLKSNERISISNEILNQINYEPEQEIASINPIHDNLSQNISETNPDAADEDLIDLNKTNNINDDKQNDINSTQTDVNQQQNVNSNQAYDDEQNDINSTQPYYDQQININPNQPDDDQQQSVNSHQTNDDQQNIVQNNDKNQPDYNENKLNVEPTEVNQSLPKGSNQQNKTRKKVTFAPIDIGHSIQKKNSLTSSKPPIQTSTQDDTKRTNISSKKTQKKTRKRNCKKAKTYDKYTNMFIQMGSSKELLSISVINSHYLLALIGFFISIIVLLIVGVFVNIESKSMMAIPYKVFFSASFDSILSNSVNGMLRRMALDQNHPFRADTKESILDDMTGISLEYESLLNDFLFGNNKSRKSGIVSAGSSLIYQIAGDTNLWINKTNGHDQLTSMPRLLMLNVLYQKYDDILQRSKQENSYFGSFDYDSILYVHVIDDHIFQNVFSSRLKLVYSEQASSAIYRVNATLFSISAVMFVIGICLWAFIQYNLIDIKNTTKFCLSTLSMIDHKFLNENNQIMQMLSGNFSKNFNRSENDNNFSSFFQVVAEKITDCIFLFDNQNNLITLNDAAKETFNIDDQLVSQVPIAQYILLFNLPIIPNESINLSSQNLNDNLEITLNDKNENKKINSSRNDRNTSLAEKSIGGRHNTLGDFLDKFTDDEMDEISIDVSVSTLNSDEINGFIMAPMNLTVVKVPDEGGFAIVLRSLIKNEKILSEIKTVEAQINQLKYKVIPPEVITMVDSDNKFFVNHVAIVVVEMYGYDAFAEGRSAHELISRLQKFFRIIDSIVYEANDALKLRNLNVSSFIALNMVKRTTNSRNIIDDAIELCQKIAIRLKQRNIDFRFGMTFDSNITAGMISNERLIFDVFSEAVDIAYSLSRKAEPTSIYLNNKVKEYLHPHDKSELVPIQLSIDGEHTEQFYKLSLH